MISDPASLVRAAAAGDSTAWEQLVDGYARLLWSIGASFRLQPAEAADVFQTTWLRLLENLDRLQDPARVGSWLATTCRRECIAVLRRGGRVVPLETDEALDAVAGPGLVTEAPVMRAERDKALWHAFGTLSLRCQQVLRVLVADAEDGPPHYPDVAAALGIPVGSLGPTRSRCLQHLRRNLAAAGIYAAEADS